MKNWVCRWKDGSCPFKSAQRSLERHLKRYHEGKRLPLCVKGTMCLIVHSDSSNEKVKVINRRKVNLMNTN